MTDETKKQPKKDAPAAKGAAAKQGARAESEGLRGLAAVDEVLRQPSVAALCERFPRDLVVDAVRAVIDHLRRDILEQKAEGAAADLSAAMLAPWVEALLMTAVTPSLRRVINASGVVVHTNLGRSMLPVEALEAIIMAAANYSDLEFDLGAGERASRQDHVHDVLCTLTGAEDALVVNNNAAAVLLALAATSRGGDVLVSRGQLVEIGDSFRIPDILVESGAALVEVGTTNRTHLEDYEKAWSERAKAVLRVHTSNYRIVGFTSEPPIGELATFAHEHGGVLVDDLGSGALADLELFADEPSVAESIAAGADVVTFSGDKLLGGPQAGIAVGSAAVIGAMRKHPLARAVRIDKLDLAALDALLRLYLDPARAIERIPTLAMLATPEDALQARATRLRDALIGVGASTEQKALCLATEDVAIVASVARAGAGALPITEVPSVAVSIAPPGGDAERLASRLRRGEPGVVGRVHDDHVLLDLRTVRDDEVSELAACVLVALG
jgi:L-seryl-tRNA(Ser) seleniumtransferase